MIGQTLSHYRILGSLGAGGMGIVYLAEDQRLGRKVALKFLPTEAAHDQQALDRFRLEARTASSLSHPGICAIHDIGVHDETPYIVMELLKGETLRERVARGPLKIADVLDIGTQLADALEAAHAQGIVHRDIKPANIWVGEKLRVKILDFGLAKLARENALLSTGAADVTGAATRTTQAARRPVIENQLTAPGTAIGTVSYMSPEQARGEDVDHRTDIFSLGVVLYEMVTGRQAFGGSTSAVVFDAILNRAPVSPVLLNPDTPQRLVEAINTALEKDRDLRFQTAASLEADLKRIRRDLQSGAIASASHAAAPGSSPTGATAAQSAAATAAAVAATPVASSSASTVAVPAAGRSWLLPSVAVAFLGLGGFWAANNLRPSTPAIDASAEVQRAQARLNARDYRAALAEAAAALAHEPANAEAARIRTAAEKGLATLDGLLDAARSALAANDPVAAARALASAQALAPGDAQVAEIGAQLASTPAPPTTEPRGAAPAPAPLTRPPAVPAPVAARPPAATAGRPEPRVPVVPPVATPAPSPPAAATVPAVVTPAPAPIVAPPPSATPPPTPPPRVDVPATDRRPVVAEPPPIPAAAPVIPARESDDTLVRRALDTYKRAIEGKDVALFRSVRPALSADDERRLRASFAQVERQVIEMRVEQLTVSGDKAEVRVARVDTVHSGGREQTSRSTQTIHLARRGAGWIIVELGR